MTKAGVPCVPGYHGSDQSPSLLASQAESIGYPVLIKAVMGGGGKGMKVVESAEGFGEALESAKREALKAFGDERVLVEKYIVRPRHVEVQVFGDQQGNVVSLWERDCSVQRRHQKIIEEAPAPGISEEIRAELGRKAVAAAKAVKYEGAGTVEFIFDNDTSKFYFMEMNTRLQVEHPVTEMITQQDLVEWQLEVASGNPLPLTQEQIPRVGHAFEARIYAENPRNNFLPDVGPLLYLSTPTPSENLRLEEGFLQGSNIEVYYDPLISKLVAHGRDRTEALRVLRKALEEYKVVGVSTNIQFLRTLSGHTDFIKGDVETSFINKHFDELFPVIQPPSPELLLQAALFIVLRDNATSFAPKEPATPWNSLHSRRFGDDVQQRTVMFTTSAESTHPDEVRVISRAAAPDGKESIFDIEVVRRNNDSPENPTITKFEGVKAALASPTSISCTFSNAKHLTTVVPQLPQAHLPASPQNAERLHIFYNDPTGNGELKTTLYVPPPKWLLSLGGDVINASVKKGIRAPMPSMVVEVKVAVGEVVKKGQAIVVLESMKTESVLRSDKDGKIVSIGCKKGEMVEEGLELVVIGELEN
ncbi:hypothetical protein FRC02_008263 [Tulasnella sp. 418]|nr:hypothetical protein FRC02_008263 [Tulasnella sp. 418]